MPSAEFEKNLDKYAEVIIKGGLNIRPGQRLLIGARAGVPVGAADFTRRVVRAAYAAGAKFVDVIWDDDQIDLIRLQNAPRDSFEEFASWKPQAAQAYGERGDALLTIVSTDPDLFRNENPELVSTVQRTRNRLYKGLLEQIAKSTTNWLIVCVPSPGWCAKVLPETSPALREAQMWDTIFDICRVKNADPVGDWHAHAKALIARGDYLTARAYTALKYTAPGTDLTVGLPPGHLWRGGGITARNGIFFVPNMPTEEVFTLPHRENVNGVVKSARPLVVGGALIDDFTLTFEGGRVVNAVAETGEVTLRRLLETDEGARHIGEVALVPNSSPVSQSGLLFYNTLYDENASNHIALGNALQFCLKDGEAMSDSQFAAAGGNQSLIHVDFMVGSTQMDVDGVLPDGSSESVMRGGNWAFDV